MKSWLWPLAGLLAFLAGIFITPPIAISLGLLQTPPTFVGTANAAPVKSSPFVKLEDKIGWGSGVHIGNGYILSAAHVVGDKATINLKGSNGRSQEATVLWTNADYDIALLRAAKPEYLESATLSCEANHVGQHVVAYGNPLDPELDFTHTSGEVVGDERAIGHWKVALPVDITVAPGQSGGAAMDDRGNVVGIVVAITNGYAFGIIVPSRVACMLMGRTA